ncbi:hypothetical protein PPSIR1_35262 [Plesiocystis pacifica SIR-1]|uniref:Uncharacterized protein n=1 Tax=Plesiocystis pacifica SIR-1 TaxID=391625 RepID=A6G3W0_9BACT|nr:hypothetical protein [Plesiocystis pacifica]EDM79497.1 hypothetical protein PPSIR1_35262 [Plesiocystis pacifica SIR-1]
MPRRRRAPKPPEPQAWRAKTEAAFHTPASFAAYKQAQGFALLGVMGYAGSWRRTGKTGAALKAHVAAARAALEAELCAARERHGIKLVMASGATNNGVLELAYDLCVELGILAMGITSGRALAYEVGAMDFVVPVGSRFGDESQDFVELCDEFLVLGGGDQSLAEAEAALAVDKPVRVIVGFGGAADALAAREELTQLVRVGP